LSCERMASLVLPPLNFLSNCSRAAEGREGESQDLVGFWSLGLGVELGEVEDWSWFWSEGGGAEVVVGLYFIAFFGLLVPNARPVRPFRETLQLNWWVGVHRVAVDGVRRERRGEPLVRRRTSAALRSSISLIGGQ